MTTSPITSADRTVSRGESARQSAPHWSTAVLRLFAYLLAFGSGAAFMFAVDRFVSTEPQPIEASESQALLRPLAAEESSNPELKTVPTETTELETNRNVGDQSSASTEAKDVFETLEVPGVTEPAPGRFAKLPLATSQAVAFVDVKVGDRVKKGWQVFSHWESPERLQAVKKELERTRKLVEVAKARAVSADQNVQRMRNLKGSLAVQEMEDAETTAKIRAAELQAAQSAVEQAESHLAAMEFEFEQAFVTSPIEGVVTSVDVSPGDRRQLTGPFRGVTVLDPEVLHCRCLLTTEELGQLEDVSRRQARDLSPIDRLRKAIEITIQSAGHTWPATIESVGLQSDPNTGRIPVILEVSNQDETLRSGIQVQVTFRAKSSSP